MEGAYPAAKGRKRGEPGGSASTTIRSPTRRLHMVHALQDQQQATLRCQASGVRSGSMLQVKAVMKSWTVCTLRLGHQEFSPQRCAWTVVLDSSLHTLEGVSSSLASI